MMKLTSWCWKVRGLGVVGVGEVVVVEVVGVLLGLSPSPLFPPPPALF